MTKRERTYYRVTFTNEVGEEEEIIQVTARYVSPSDMYGLVEISGFVFPEGGLLHNPQTERIRKEFADIKRTWLPYHAILRIDEVSDASAADLRVVPMDGTRKSPEKVPSKNS
ncbi:MAG: DUF1820 family protein [Deltaproteobacteria bacterium]|nr:DUF1820 family protein [Deltaproteobacteria bacterium]